MGAKDNFQQAVKELLNGEIKSNKPEPAPTAAVEKKAAAPTQVSTPVRATSTTVIAEDTVIIGEVRVGGDLNLFGSVKGNVSAKGDIRISGKVVGNVNGNNLTMNGGAVKGDASAQGNMEMNNASLVLGNVSAQELLLDGRIKGDVKAIGSTTLNPSSIVNGDIYSGTINMATGARVQGELHITKLEPVENSFKETDFDIDI